MDNKIIFPFDYKKDNREMFVRTFQIAELKNAKVVLFTTIAKEDPETEEDQVYNHLFELNGFFQTYFNKWKRIKLPIERVIRRGDLSENLVEYLSEIKYPVEVVVSKNSEAMNKEKLEVLFEKLPLPPNLIK